MHRAPVLMPLPIVLSILAAACTQTQRGSGASQDTDSSVEGGQYDAGSQSGDAALPGADIDDAGGTPRDAGPTPGPMAEPACAPTDSPLSIDPFEPTMGLHSSQTFTLVGGEGLDEACWHWAVSPTSVFQPNPFTGGSDTDVEIDPVSGHLSYGALRAGTWLEVRAVSGQTVLATTRVYVFDASRVLNGFWVEQARLECDGSRTELLRGDGIGELWFGNGEFTVTFSPFETYRDYWGTPQALVDRLDDHRGTLVLAVEDGNQIPPNLDIDGRYELSRVPGEPGELLLRDMWLGPEYDPGCGHYFARF